MSDRIPDEETPSAPEAAPVKAPPPRRPVVTEPGRAEVTGAIIILWLLMAGAWKTVEVIAVTIQILARAFS